MKTVSSDYQKALKGNVDVIDKIFLYEQETYTVTAVSSNTLTVQSSSSFFSVGDYVCIPFKDFSKDYKITNISTISTNGVENQTLTLDSYESSSTDVGLFVAKRHDLTEKLSSNRISNSKQAIEGRTLNSFDSGSISFIVDNSDEFFISDSSIGLFDSNKVFWVKYIPMIKGISDQIIFFGGLLDLRRIVPDLYSNSITLYANGHTSELERYPIYNICDVNNGQLPLISGIEITGYDKSDLSEEGIKQIKFEPFTNSKFKGVYVESVSKSVQPGLKLLEYRFPNLFKWDNGDWTEISSYPTDGIKTLNGQIGSCQLLVGSGGDLNQFPDSDAETWVLVKSDEVNDNGRVIANQGVPKFTFDNGISETVKITFQRIINSDNNDTTFTDITQEINDASDSIEVLQDGSPNNDSVILISSERFFGFEIEMSEHFSSGSLQFYHSIGGDQWSSNFSTNETFVDSTNSFQNDGEVTWGELNGWAINNITPDASTQYKGYMIKISNIVSVGTLSIKTLTRKMRAQGQNGDFVSFKTIKDLLPREEVEDELILLDNNGIFSFGTWYNSVPLQTLFNKFEEVANYSGKVNKDSLEISNDEKLFNDWGIVPKYTISEKPTAWYVDFDNEYVYVANSLEVYRASFSGSWEKVFDLNGIEFLGTIYNDPYKIWRLNVYDNKVYVAIWTIDGKPLGNRIYFYYYDLSTNTLVEVTYTDKVYTGEWLAREGHYYPSGSFKNRRVGVTDAGSDVCENICIPYSQKVYTNEKTKLVAMYPTKTQNQASNDLPEWYFITSRWDGGNQGDEFPNGYSHYHVQNNSFNTDPIDALGITFQMGQDGCVIFYNGRYVAWVGKETDENSVLAQKYFRFEWETNPDLTPLKLTRGNTANLPICQTGSLIGDLYLGFSEYNDNEFNTDVAYSYLSKANRVLDWKSVVEVDSSDIIQNNYTANVNLGNLVSDCIGTIDNAMIFGHEYKFKSFYLNHLEFDEETWEFYYSGSGDTWIRDDNIFDFDSNFDKFEKCVRLHDDWVKHSVHGYSIKMVMKSNVGGTKSLIGNCYPYEKIIWDSQNDTGNEHQVLINMELDTDNEIIYGCTLNKANDSSQSYPFQWSLFAFDLDTETMTFIRDANNYTFQGSYVYKNFTYNSDEQVMYAISENIRYKDTNSFLVKLYKSDDGSFKVDLIDYLRDGDWGAIHNLYYGNEKLFGITKGTDYALWEYSKQFSPRIELAKFGGGNLKDFLNYVAEFMMFYYTIKSEREIEFLVRNNYNGSVEISYDTNLTNNKPKFNYWQNQYDSVFVKWENFTNGKKGNNKKGFTGWNKKKLNISSNPLIQNRYISNYIAKLSYEYFIKYRYFIEQISISFSPEKELIDKATLFIPNKIAKINSNLEYIVYEMELKSNRKLTLKLLQIK